MSVPRPAGRPAGTPQIDKIKNDFEIYHKPQNYWSAIPVELGGPPEGPNLNPTLSARLLRRHIHRRRSKAEPQSWLPGRRSGLTPRLSLGRP